MNRTHGLRHIVIALMVALIATVIGIPPASAKIDKPFTACPQAGPSTSCRYMLEIWGDSDEALWDLYRDPAQPTVNSLNDVTVGVRNDATGVALNSVIITYPPMQQGWAGGACGLANPMPSDCPPAASNPWGYAGPGTRVEFEDIGDSARVMRIYFEPLMPGQQTWFSIPHGAGLRPTWSVSTDADYEVPGPKVLNGLQNKLDKLAKCFKGDPVNCATGNLVEEATDIHVPARGEDLRVRRTYNAEEAKTATVMGRFGYGWSDDYGRHLVVGASSVTYFSGTGAEAVFQQSGSTYTAASYVLGSLKKKSDGTFEVTHSDRSVERFNAAGRLVSVVDRLGEPTSFTYDNSGRLAAVADGANRKILFTYNTDGTVASATDPMGRTTSYGYTAGRLMQVTAPGSRVTSYIYGTNRSLVSWTDPNGGVVTNTFDSSGRVTKQVDPEGRVIRWEYTGNRAIDSGDYEGSTAVTYPNGRTDVLTFDRWARLSSRVVGIDIDSPRNWSYTYDPATGQQNGIRDPLGNFLRRTFDAQGNLTQQVDQDGTFLNWDYNTDNNVTSSTDEMDVTTTFAYNPNGTLKSVSTPIGDGRDAITRLKYTNTSHPGDITGVVDPNGNETTYTWSGQGDRATQVQADGSTTHWTYDLNSRLTKEATPRQQAASKATTYAYNAAGALTTVTGPRDGVQTFTYNGNGWLTSATDADGYVTKLTYNKVGEVIKTQRPDGSAITQTWTPSGELADQDNGPTVLSWTYNEFDEVVTEHNSAGVTEHTYDLGGNRITTNDPLGRTTTRTHDSAGRVTSVKYSDPGTADVTYEYDKSGRMTSMVDGTGNSTWTYDNLGHVTETTSETAGTIGYEYDLNGNVIGLTYPDGQVAQRTFNALNQLDSLTFGSGNAKIDASFGYDSDGNLDHITYPDGSISTRSYDLDGNVTSIKDTKGNLTLLNAPYQYTAAGRVSRYNQTPVITAVGDTTAALTSVDVTRDANARISQIKLPGLLGAAVEKYAHTPAGDLTERVRGSLLVDLGKNTLSYDGSSQELTEQTLSLAGVPLAKAQYAFDDLGQRTSAVYRGPLGGTPIAETDFHYNQAGQLTGFEGAPLSVVNKTATSLLSQITQQEIDVNLHLAYRYDGRGRLAGLGYDETVPERPAVITDGLHNFILGPGGMPIAQTININVINLNVGGTATLPLTVNGTQISNALRSVLNELPPLVLHTDRQASTRLVTTKSSLPVASFSYDAYGASTLKGLSQVLGLSASSLLLPLQYTGAYTDPQAGLIYLANRWYDPYTAQFLSQDPVQALTHDPYAYTGGDPLTHTDPYGLCPAGLGWLCDVGGWFADRDNLSTVAAGGAIVAYGFCWAGGSGCALGAGLSVVSAGLDTYQTVKSCMSGNGPDCFSGLAAAGLAIIFKGLGDDLVWSGKHVDEFYIRTSEAGWEAVVIAGTEITTMTLHGFLKAIC